MFLKGQTCLKWPQWWVFQRFSRAAGMSSFRQIAVQVHQQSVDTAGPGPGNNRPAAVIRRNSPWRQIGAQGTIVTRRNLAMKGAKMCEHCQSKAVAEKTVELFHTGVSINCSALHHSVIPFKQKERNTPGILPIICFIRVNIYLGKF